MTIGARTKPLEPIPYKLPVSVDTHAMPEIIDGETRIVDPKTGGEKGVKDTRFDLFPPEALEEVAKVYGFGAKKYADNNWAKGYSWRLSFGAMMRHAWAWFRGEDLDPETGLHHMAHVAWHCFTIMTFQRENLGTDDRLFKFIRAHKKSDGEV